MNQRQGETLNAAAGASSGIARGAAVGEDVKASGRYAVKCFDRHGNLKWQDEIKNLVTTVGKNDALDKYLAGSSYTAAWYIGLIGSASYTTGPAAGDTSSSHAGWEENTAYSQASRATAAFSAAAAGAKALSSDLSFSINANDQTIKGCFLISNATKGGSTGILYSAGLFSNGDKVLDDGDTLSVGYEASL